jgi:hypothetical protein
MKKLLLAGCLWPALAGAQEVKPIYSDDYQLLIHKDSTGNTFRDSSNSMHTARLKFQGYAHYRTNNIRKITIRKDSTLELKSLVTRALYLGGSWSSTAEWQRVNRQPALQQEYTQGRSINGQLSWQGPETNEVFSYGPAVKQLEYNSQPYPYDIYGRLVAVGTGNGQPARVYNNSVLRPGSYLSNNLVLNLRSSIYAGKSLSVSFKTGQTRENTIIRDNKNQNRNTAFNIEAQTDRITFNGNYNFRDDRYGHSNRDGFLNKLYRESLLTPFSFSNAQGTTLNNSQRAYSQLADNPFFLLEHPTAGFRRQQYSTMTGLSYRANRLRFKLSQSYDHTKQASDESLPISANSFPTGRILHRDQQDKNYSLQSGAIGDFSIGYQNNLQLNLNYNYSDHGTGISYGSAHPGYNFHRSSHNLTFSLSPTFRGYEHETGINLAYSFFTSTTSNRSYWLPMISAYHRFIRFLAIDKLNLKLFGSYNRFNSELPLSKSLAAVSLLTLDPDEVAKYSPMLEAQTFTGLQPIEHREFQIGLDIQFGYLFTLNGNWFNRSIRNDIFPVIRNNSLQLQNMASHFNRGIELQFDYNTWLNTPGKVKTGISLSFVRYQSKVTRIRQGYEQTPLAGFRNIHTALVKGEPLGVIVGSGWERNGSQQIRIGQDGFPIASSQLNVLGSPIPDFTMKLSDKLRYKKWDFRVDLEWRKGGVSWNGTQAMLDYYGRSAASASARGTSNYIFDGVLANGSHNMIPVSFYDPSLPFNQNRWVRYGATGVAEDYIQKADQFRISAIILTWKPVFKKFIGLPSISAYANNILLWSPYKGADTNQLLFDQSGTQGLDFFNLPAFRSAGISLSIQF